MTEYTSSLCDRDGHVFQTLGQWSPWGDPLPWYCLRCGERKPDKQPEIKKEKPMASLEINTQLFDGLSLHQRMRAMLEIQFQLNEATEKRMDKGKDCGESCVTNGQFVAFCVIEEVLKEVQQNLIDSTVEKFGGGK